MKKFIKDIGKKIGIIKEDKTKEIREQRSAIRENLRKSLQQIGFNEEEVAEVTVILTKAERAVQVKKDELIGTNINNDHTTEIMKKVFDEIREIELKAASDIKTKIAEIKYRKGMR